MKKATYSAIIAIKNVSHWNMAGTMRTVGELTVLLGSMLTVFGEVIETKSISRDKLAFDGDCAVKEVDRICNELQQK